MTEKFKKIDRPYVLSDSSVNVYGFRLLTSGYQLDAFSKNPIGYFMHRREDGIALKWDDLKIADDKIWGTPVINLSNPRGEQTCDEVEFGFLNAASVGHIVVLEYSTDPELMLPGQTGPTITRWYNKECSLVDIPGNCNALTTLYDAQENALSLPDLGAPALWTVPGQPDMLTALRKALQLGDTADANELPALVQQLAGKAMTLEQENTALQTQLKALSERTAQQGIAALLDRALEDRKLTVELRNRLATDYAGNAPGLSALLAAMPAYQPVVDMLKQNSDAGQANWQWDDYELHDPAGKKLRALRANDPAKYKELFDRKFAA